MGYTPLHTAFSNSTGRTWLARRFVIVGAVVCTLIVLLTAHQTEVVTFDSLSNLSILPDRGHELYQALRDAIDAAPANRTAGWTDGEAPLHLLGSPATFIELPNEDVIDVRTGEPFPGELEGGAFNLAVLKLPPQSSFQLLGIARGPTRNRPFMVVNGHKAREQSLAVFGLNVRRDGSLVVVTKAHALDYQLIPREACEMSGHWIATYGVEDARIFWTDAGTPAITFARGSDSNKLCRSVGLIPDVRRYFPFADEAIAPNSRYGVAPFGGQIKPGESESLELRRAAGNTPVEKNWAAFFPGPRRDPKMLYPSISYSLAPAQVLEVTESTPRMIEYTATVIPEAAAKCVQRVHRWDPRANHQASPLYRFTMCERGCTPHEGNTVNVAVAHAKLRGRQYMKYFVTYNTTAPFNPISVGPAMFVHGPEIDDPKKINFALSLVPLEAADLDSTAKRTAGKGYGPGHIFLDDTVLMTLGHADERMISTTFPAEEMLSRHKMCDQVVDES